LRGVRGGGTPGEHGNVRHAGREVEPARERARKKEMEVVISHAGDRRWLGRLGEGRAVALESQAARLASPALHLPGSEAGTQGREAGPSHVAAMLRLQRERRCGSLVPGLAPDQHFHSDRFRQCVPTRSAKPKYSDMEVRRMAILPIPMSQLSHVPQLCSLHRCLPLLVGPRSLLDEYTVPSSLCLLASSICPSNPLPHPRSFATVPKRKCTRQAPRARPFHRHAHNGSPLAGQRGTAQDLLQGSQHV